MFVAHAAPSVAAVTQTLPATGLITFADTAVGSTSTASVQLTLNTSATLTLSTPTSAGGFTEFTIGAVSGCATDGTTVVASGSVCSFTVTFKPHYPGARQMPLSATVEGQVYTFGMLGYASGPLTRIDPGYTLTVAGASSHATPVFNVPASQGLLYLSRGIFVDSSENIYIADTGNYVTDVIYQNANPQLACLIITESPATFGASGNNGCADATSQPAVGNIYQVAGQVGSLTTTNTGGLRATSTKVDPYSVSVDAYGNIYQPDDQGRLRVVYQGGASFACLLIIEDPTLFGLPSGSTSCTGATSQPVPGDSYNLAGTGTSGTTGDGALASAAEIINPSDVAVDAAGDVFLSTFGATVGGENGRIRVVYNGGALAAQLITLENPTVTTPVIGYIYSVGGGLSAEGADGVLATKSGIAASYGVRVDRYGNIIFTDKTYSTGMPLAVAKVRVIYNGSSAAANPMANLIAIENPGTTAQPGFIYTIAGGAGVAAGASQVEDGVLATSSHFVGPYQMTMDAAGDIYVADDLNDTIRRISASTGVINTVMGVADVLAVNNGLTSELYSPLGVGVSPSGNVYFTDSGAYRIRVSVPLDSAQAQTYATANSIADHITLPSSAANSVSGIKSFMATNIGTSPLTITADGATSDELTASFGFLSPASGSLLTWPGISECAPTSTTQLTVPSITSAVSLASGASCQVGVAAESTTAGTFTGTATITDNSTATAGTVHSLYYSAAVTGVAITFSANPVAPTVGKSAQLTATLVNGTTAVTAGTVTFTTTGGTVLGSGTLSATGTVTITTTTLPVGTDPIIITYGGATATNALFTPATLTTSLVVYALPVPVMTITASPTATTAGTPVTLTVKTTSTAGTPTGEVDIIDTLGTTGTPTTVCSTTALAASGTYTCTLATLPAGTNTLKAVYDGDANFAAASTTTSAKVVVTALPTTITVSATPTVANAAQSVSITATVGGYVSGVSFSGSVTFTDTFVAQTTGTKATITYGPIAVNPTTGVATYTTTTLAGGTHTITAVFGNDLLYGASPVSASTVVTVTNSAFSVTPTSTSPVGTIAAPGTVAQAYSVGLEMQQGSTATITFSLATVGGYTGTVAASCVGAAGLTCSMSPTSTVFTGLNNTTTVVGTIHAATASASLARGTSGPILAFLGLPGLVLLCLRGKSKKHWGRLAGVVLLSGMALTGLGGCGKSANHIGTYQVTMSFADGTTTVSVPVTVTVQGVTSDSN